LLVAFGKNAANLSHHGFTGASQPGAVASNP
jgi:hypothetical protein